MLFSKTPIKLYIGNLEAYPRNDFLHHLEVGSSKHAVLEKSFQEILQEVFPHTKTTSLITPQASDVAVDIKVEAYSRGSALEFHANHFFMPVMWRPMIKISAELAYIKTGKKKGHITITRRMSWIEFLVSLFELKVFFGFSSPTSQNRLEELLLQAALALKAKIEKQL
ncbi:MAG: hypothetical protein KBA75_00680 [Alphaproteobacteria bacterium]|nr:hypothetical protein [Alphaproteobacteria bacterium]